MWFSVRINVLGIACLKSSYVRGKTHEENASQKKDCTTDNARVKGETACLRDTFDIQNALQAA